MPNSDTRCFKRRTSQKGTMAARILTGIRQSTILPRLAKNQSMKVTSKDFLKVELHDFSVTIQPKNLNLKPGEVFVFDFKFDLGKNSFPRPNPHHHCHVPLCPWTTVVSQGVLLMGCWMGRRTARRTVQRSCSYPSCKGPKTVVFFAWISVHFLFGCTTCTMGPPNLYF